MYGVKVASAKTLSLYNTCILNNGKIKLTETFTFLGLLELLELLESTHSVNIFQDLKIS